MYISVTVILGVFSRHTGTGEHKVKIFGVVLHTSYIHVYRVSDQLSATMYIRTSDTFLCKGRTSYVNESGTKMYANDGVKKFIFIGASQGKLCVMEDSIRSPQRSAQLTYYQML